MNYFTAKDVMNPHVICVPGEWTIEDVAQFFVDKSITGAPVKDENGKLIGVVSLTDIVRHDCLAELEARADEPNDYYMHGWEERLAPDDLASFHVEEKTRLSVREIMTPLIFKVDENTPIQTVADTMLGGRVHRLLVTHDDTIAGIITTIDMLKAIRELPCTKS